MSTDDREDGKPEFPARDDAQGAGQGAEAAPPLPEFPGWQAPAGDTDAAKTGAPAHEPVQPRVDPSERPEPRVEIPEPIQMPAAERVSHTDQPVRSDARPTADTGAGRDAIGGPYVVTDPATPAAGRSADDAGRTPYPAAAFVPAAASSGPASAAGQPASPSAGSTPAPASVSDDYPPYQPVPQPISAPLPPQPKGNRGFGSLIAVLGTIVFAAVYAVVSFFVIGANLTGEAAVSAFLQFLATAAFIVPVVVFALALVLIVLIVNRAGWWAYVLGGFVVAVLVYFAGIAGALIHVQAWNWQPQEQYDFVRSLTMDPLTLAGAIVAREASIWTGAWIAVRGRRVKARNAAARAEFDRAREQEQRGAVEGESSRGEPSAPITNW
ncbi:hypothetical protein [Herbiconiux liangxiaofengii]|uniref:hypothetical protein n=1 Tax=Herbiconiux liangxiaofengii TaxID=3342795 RepID=UPI0035BB3C29